MIFDSQNHVKSWTDASLSLSGRHNFGPLSQQQLVAAHRSDDESSFIMNSVVLSMGIMCYNDPDKCFFVRSDLLKEFSTDAKHHPENLNIVQALMASSPRSAVWNGAVAEQDASVSPAVRFPCALVSIDKTWQLHEASTFFFVLAATYPGKDDHVSASYCVS